MAMSQCQEGKTSPIVLKKLFLYINQVYEVISRNFEVQPFYNEKKI